MWVIPPTFQPDGTTCVRAQYGQRKDGTVSVYNSGTNPQGQFTEICGIAYQTEPQKSPGDLAVQFPVSPMDGPYQVLDTDYYTYAVVFSCTDRVIGSSTANWILTRSPYPSQATVRIIS